MTRHQLRAARALLVLQQEVLAVKAKVGITSIRLFENGNGVGQDIVDRLRDAIEEEGAVLVGAGANVDGVEVGGGVVLRRKLPAETKERLEKFNLTSRQASEALPEEQRRTGAGRRARVPLPSDVHRVVGKGRVVSEE